MYYGLSMVLLGEFLLFGQLLQLVYLALIIIIAFIAVPKEEKELIERFGKEYKDYLKKVPDDLATMMKLGTLYKDLRAGEAARMAFNYVLDRDPGNGAAKAMLENELSSLLEY